MNHNKAKPDKFRSKEAKKKKLNYLRQSNTKWIYTANRLDIKQNPVQTSQIRVKQGRTKPNQTKLNQTTPQHETPKPH